MSSKTDQKSLELLYENVVESKELLLEEEKQYIDKASKDIVSQLYQHIKENNLTSYNVLRERLCNLIYSERLDLDQSDYKHYFSNTNHEEKEAITHIFEDVVLKYLFEYQIHLVARGGRTYLTFQQLEDFSHMLFDKQVEIPIDNKDLVLQMFKNTLSNSIIYLYDKRPHQQVKNLNNKSNKWYEWREEKLKFQGLRKKLPELEGIFN